MKYIKLFEGFRDINDLIKKLKEFNIPIDTWNTNEYKSVDNLMQEIESDDCYLKEQDGRLVRHVDFATIVIYYKDGDGVLKLKEDRQEFSDGRVRKRNQDGVSEKMKQGEIPVESAIRGIKEELDVVVEKSQLNYIEESNKESDSVSYPGLSAKYKKYLFKCYLNKEQFNPDGYIEVQENLKTFFKWEKEE